MTKNARIQLGKTWRVRNISVKTITNGQRLVRTIVFSIFSHDADARSLKTEERKVIDT